jgi:hypothetical protein
MNEVSSRSHALFILIVEQHILLDEENASRKLHPVHSVTPFLSSADLIPFVLSS